MTRDEAIAYLTRCEDREGHHWSRGVKWGLRECPTCNGTNQAGHLKTPGSRYGHNSAACAPIAYAAAVIVAGETGHSVDEDLLDHMMSLVVNDHHDPEALIRDYGSLYGLNPEVLLD